MSALAGILSAFETLAEGAVAGLTVSRQPRAAAAIPADLFPHLVVLGVDYSGEAFEYAGELRTWSVTAVLLRPRSNAPLDFSVDGDREILALDLEALAAAVRADPRLGGACERAVLAGGSILTHGESGWAELPLVLSAQVTA